MRKLNYNTAVDLALQGHGFERKKSAWRRISGPYIDIFEVQISSNLRELTINIDIVDKLTFEIYTGNETDIWTHFYYVFTSMRLGSLVDLRDRWWSRSDPETPGKILEAVRNLGMPYVENAHSLDFLHSQFQRQVNRPWSGAHDYVFMAITRARMGRIEEALDLLKDPPLKNIYTDEMLEPIRHRIRQEGRRQSLKMPDESGSGN